MSKQQVCQKFIFKIHSTRLRKAKWKLNLPLAEARRNNEIISLADSLMLRWIDELNGITDAEPKAREIKEQIKTIKKQPNSVKNKREIKGLYAQLDQIQFKPDYMCLIIDHNKDYYKALNGFSINDVEYVRLLGTNGGIKNSTIVFVSKRLAPELRSRVECGRDPEQPMVPAKLEAYKALTCSASIPVSSPQGILVVSDVETTFKTDYIYLTDENDGEPEMSLKHNQDVTVDASDGYGLMLPSLAERWSFELGLDYVISGVNTRCAYTKGMVFTFDFLDFAENVAHSYIVKDAWGNDIDIRNVELVLTTSMLKLWDNYKSIDHYIECCKQNKYTFSITKSSPKELESERRLNYQFIQSYDLNDDDIDKLISPTVNEIKDVLSGDWRKTVLFLKGSGLTEENIMAQENNFAKAIMIDRSVMNDTYVTNTIYQLIRNRINEAKVGVLNVHGNYSIISGDPYALCQHIFEMEVTGLLRAGEIYNKYWSDYGATELACFRAPMTCHANIRKVKPISNYDTDHWYKYITTCTILNAWDTMCAALNGADLNKVPYCSNAV